MGQMLKSGAAALMFSSASAASEEIDRKGDDQYSASPSQFPSDL